MLARTVTLLTALADRARRETAALELAQHLGAEELVVFARDPEIDAHLPALGFPKTLPKARAWRDLVTRCTTSQKLEHADLTSPSTGATRRAIGLAFDTDCVLVLLGGEPLANLLEGVRHAAPLLGALFSAERKEAAGQGHAMLARSVAERAEQLTASLAASQAELHSVLHRLSASEQWLSVTLRSIGDAVIATDQNGRVTFLNAAAESLTGHSTSEAVGRPMAEVFEIIHEHTGTTVDNPVDTVLRTREPVELANHTLLVRKDRSTVVIEDSAAPIREGTGELVGVVLVFRDVTARRFADRELAIQHRHAQLVANVGTALASTADLPAQLQECTEAIVRHLDAAFARIWTLDSSSEMLELRASAGLYTHLDGAHARVPVGAFKIGLIAHERVPHTTNDVQDDPRVSDKAWAKREGMTAFAGYPLLLEGRLVGVVALFARRALESTTLGALASIADQVAVAIDRDAVERAIRGAIRARETLLAIVSHDLRDPLSTIGMSSNLLQQTLPEEDARSHKIVSTLNRAASRMTRMVGDLLDFASIDAGQLAIERSALSANDLVREAVDSHQSLAEQESLTLKASIDAHQPVVRADRERILQVFANLIGNAIKFTPAGGVISISCAVAGTEIVFAVADTGPGIREDVLPYVFDPYRQAKETARQGLGLGLFIAKGIVQAHAGRVWAESRLGHGARFLFTLPLAAQYSEP